MSRRWMASSLVYALLAVLWPVHAPAAGVVQNSAQSPALGRLRGTATDAVRQPLPNVQVKLVDASDTAVAETTSNAQGHFEVNSVPPGIYTLRIYWQGRLIGVAGGVQVTAGTVTDATVTGVGPGPCMCGEALTETTKKVIITVITVVTPIPIILPRQPRASPSR